MALPTKLANNTRRLGLLMEMVSLGCLASLGSRTRCALYTRSYLPSCARRKPIGNTTPSLRYFEMNPSARTDCTIVSAQRKLATAETQVTGLRMAALERAFGAIK